MLPDHEEPVLQSLWVCPKWPHQQSPNTYCFAKVQLNVEMMAQNDLLTPLYFCLTF